MGLLEELSKLRNAQNADLKRKFNRDLPFNEVIGDRWQRANRLGFGEGSNIYDSSVVIGEVSVGKNCWIGPYTILDGSGGLAIGNYCTISAGVHVYTHDNLKNTISAGKCAVERETVTIGDNCYLGPHVIVSKGVKIGNCVVIAANSFLKKDATSNSIYAGTPAKRIGEVVVSEQGEVDLIYFRE